MAWHGSEEDRHKQMANSKWQMADWVHPSAQVSADAKIEGATAIGAGAPTRT